MRVLIVGAGAVGQAYGAALQRGGAEVVYLVRERHVERVRRGFHHLDRNRGAWVQVPPPADVVTDPRGVRCDASLWTQPSDALTPEWLDTFLAAQGDRPVILLQPGLHARRQVLERRPDARITQGLITLVAYEGPLPGEEDQFPQPGLSIWHPPGVSAPLEGPDAAAFVALLRAGGLPARVGAGVDHQGAFGALTLSPLVTALRLGGWRFATTDRRLAIDALHEALHVAERVRRERRPFATRLLTPMTLGWVMRLARWAMPFDAETYLELHFTKVGSQTAEHLRDARERAIDFGLPHAALDRLLAAFDAA